ncbi:MAG: hypothetical protein LBO77_08995 [Desulfovibrio sp.]|jgi:hypothetical protein|nr:hypothetical protein [Desulfovibrio sp.]
MAALVTGGNRGILSVIGAVVAADFLNKRGLDALPACPGRPAPEAAGILRRFGLKRPLENPVWAESQVVLVGEGPPPPGVEILAVLDARRPDALAPVCSPPPGIRPEEGCASFLLSLYDACGMELSRGLAGGLLCLLAAENGLPAETSGPGTTAGRLALLAGISDPLSLALQPPAGEK